MDLVQMLVVLVVVTIVALVAFRITGLIPDPTLKSIVQLLVALILILYVVSQLFPNALSF